MEEKQLISPGDKLPTLPEDFLSDPSLVFVRRLINTSKMHYSISLSTFEQRQLATPFVNPGAPFPYQTQVANFPLKEIKENKFH